MAFVSMTHLLKEAKKDGYAVGQFNINGELWVQAILRAAERLKSPVILASSDRIVDYLGGFKTIVQMVRSLTDEMKITVPVVLHLDHGQTVERCIAAIDAGYSSVMYDGSSLPIAENILNTKKVTDYAHKKFVSVEAEVGSVGGMEDGLIGGIKYADLEECKRLVKEANVDALAAALGSVHGKYQGEPVLGFPEMNAISEAVQIPLVLHGASGIPLNQLKKAIQFGHAKININTECNLAFRKTLQETLVENPDVFEPRALLLPSMMAIQNVVEEKMREFDSVNRV
ncbi:class II fructose-1,6-bisphosphate aldolase [Listeria fleischmannii]|uniref:class II fructose-1,6-bisphosphate aldolase n=1 Tax=Listeria fleischmannii TaxID=1069827 RepID=UPI000254F0B9|nr:class II fructose-1,6-bisphosphate aldolase [Listeria fleischmannii]EIA19809.1 6-phospho-5-dehydro-2-deoxy-D-gluconate aldolase [Listeria fleischmannii subsp. coloradonensis]MBC1419624.1 class II fructose-1,6-bisphosphate aldolase [Listeria fleischmannii]STY34770.1 6-phospho-5-dehydro-2-deoxy-D-gluconate aldolase [Listeria fleischmannii subsp. coloradonensis]